jgi:hypothetical protein
MTMWLYFGEMLNGDFPECLSAYGVPNVNFYMNVISPDLTCVILCLNMSE